MISMSKPTDRWLAMDEVDPKRFLWVVSDLNSKVELQECLSSQLSDQSGERVLRAGELWQELLRRCDPSLRMVSNDLALVLIRRELQRLSDPVVKTKGASAMVLKCLEQLMPLLTHPERDGIISEWFQNHPQGSQRWRTWYEISLKVWERFQEERVMLSSWVKGYLINELGYESLMERQFLFDLGGELFATEAELIWNLSRQHEVLVLRPNLTTSSLSKYDLLLSKGTVEQRDLASGHRSQLPGMGEGGRNFLKFTTMLAEVKNAMGQIRRWLDSGVQLNQVAVAIPDMDRYMVVLESYATIEEIPLKLPLTVRLHSYRDVQDWVSRLRMEVGDFSYYDLETHLYSPSAKMGLEFGKFQRSYQTLIDERDLHRRGDLKNFSFCANRPEGSVRWEEFLHWAMRFCPSSLDSSFLLEIELEGAQELLTISEWVAYFESVLARTEVEVAGPDRTGLKCVRLESAQYLKGVTHLLILGLCESQLSEKKSYLLTRGEVENLARETGFELEFSERKRLEWEMKWLLQSPFCEVVLSYPMTDFDGRAEAPSLYWLQGSTKQSGLSEISLPMKSRWDMIGEGTREEIILESHLTGVQEYRSRFLNRLMEDLGEKEFEPFGQGRCWPLSASSLEKYAQCPFIFACEKLFRFSDDPTFDLDVDPLRKGQFMHALFERLAVEPLPFHWLTPDTVDVQSLEKMVEDVREAQRLIFVDDRSWKSFKNGMVKLSIEFLRFEREWREIHPRTRTLHRELSIEGFVDRNTGKFVKEEIKEGFPFRGFIDRVDWDGENRFVILDYKSSKHGLRQWGSWLDQDELQLSCYIEAVRAGLTSIENPQVVGAFYYILKERDREIGLKVTDQGETLFSCIGNRRKNGLDSDQADDLLRAARERRRELVHHIFEGDFRPVPKDIKSCLTCQWSSLCRTNW